MRTKMLTPTKRIGAELIQLSNPDHMLVATTAVG
jgi:hypothetical protein